MKENVQKYPLLEGSQLKTNLMSSFVLVSSLQSAGIIMNRELIKHYCGILTRLLVEIIYCKCFLLFCWHSKIFRPEDEQNVYFPMITGDSIGSSEIQLANIYDIQGNALLVNEYVVLDGSYVFQRFQSSIFLLKGSMKNDKLLVWVLNTTDYPYSCT